MTLRERIADWITGGALTRAQRQRDRLLAEKWLFDECDQSRAEAANIAAQRDEAIARAEAAEKQVDALQAGYEAMGREVNMAKYGQPDFAWSVHTAAMAEAQAALRAILTARNITEARKIAKQALGEE